MSNEHGAGGGRPPIPTDKRALAEALKKRMARKGRPIAPEKRAAILGAYLSGMTMGDVALKCGISPPTVKKVIETAIAEGSEASE